MKCVGFDGTHFFCRGCGRTFSAKMGVLGHQKNCPSRKLEGIPTIQLPKESIQYFLEHRKNDAKCDVRCDAQDVAGDAEQHHRQMTPNEFFASLVRRVYAVEQDNANINRDNAELKRYVYNDLSHQSASGLDLKPMVTIWLIGLGIGFGLGWLIFSKQGTSNIGEKVVNKVVDKGVGKVLDRFL